MPRLDEEKMHRPPPKRPLEELLPPGVAEQIIEAAGEEREAILAHMAAIEAKIEEYEDLRKRIYQKASGLAKVIERAPVVHKTLEGQERTIERRPVRVKTKEQIELEQDAREIERRQRNLRSDLAAWRSRLAAVQKVERAARSGVVTVVMTMAANWRNTAVAGHIRRLSDVQRELSKAEPADHEEARPVREDLDPAPRVVRDPDEVEEGRAWPKPRGKPPKGKAEK